MKLAPAAVISGTIRDSDGEPLEGAHVVLSTFTRYWGKYRIEGDDRTDTGDRGEYRFSHLAPGKYYVGAEPRVDGWNQVDRSASAPPTEVSVPTLYPGVSDAALAAPIEVSAGGLVTGIDVRPIKSRVYRITGRVVGVTSSGPLNIELRDANNPGIWDFPMRTAARIDAGEFEVRRVPPGSYEVTVRQAPLQGRTSIVAGAADLQGVRVALMPGADINLHVDAEAGDKPDLSGLSYFLTSDGRTGYGEWRQGADRFSIRSVPPVHYTPKLSGVLLRKLYVKSATAGQTDILSDGLTVAGGETIDVKIVLADDGALVHGIVRDKDQQPVPGATVLLATDRRSRADRYATATSDQNGRYDFSAIPPGNYKLFAWEDLESNAWDDPEFLMDPEEQGRKLASDPGERKIVDLQLCRLP